MIARKKNNISTRGNLLPEEGCRVVDYGNLEVKDLTTFLFLYGPLLLNCRNSFYFCEKIKIELFHKTPPYALSDLKVQS